MTCQHQHHGECAYLGGGFMDWRDGVTASLSRIEQKQDGLSQELADFKKAVFGNGQPGHAQRIAALEKSESRWFGKSSIIGWIISALLALLIAWFGKGR